MDRGTLISVVTPVYNGAAWLAECIESVLAQTGVELEYILLDNASTDATPDIAARYAAGDPRMRVVRNPVTLPMNDNWNAALALVSPHSAWTRILCADDYLYPGALRHMMEVASRCPGVGVIGSLRLRGDRVECRGLPPGERHEGRQVVRRYLRDEVHALAPTASLIRSDFIRAAHGAFLPVKYLHADVAALLGILDQCDFGFADAVLMYSRPHEGSMTATVAERRQTWLREKFLMLREFGPRYFSGEELRRLEAGMLRRYYRFLVRSAALMREQGYLAEHVAALRQAHRSPQAMDIVRALAEEVALAITHPERVLRHLRQRMAGR
jgi:glycosyltransferase involved in cell wall biosynthesis